MGEKWGIVLPIDKLNELGNKYMSEHLKKFKPGELLYNEAETKNILAFIFPHMKNSITKIRVDDDIRGFAQGLLVEAVDASYALGFVESIFRSTIVPSKSVLAVIRKIAIKAAKHWFEHAKAKDLIDVKIYKIVQQRLQLNFKTVMQMIINGVEYKYMISRIPKPTLKQYA